MGGASEVSHNTRAVQLNEGMVIYHTNSWDHSSHVQVFERWLWREELKRRKPWTFSNHLAAAINRMCGNR
jgi:hypothetical protein